MRDNTVLECNLQDHDTALHHALQDVLRLKTQLFQLDGACGQVRQLQELLSHEMHHRERLRQENSGLQERNRELVSVIQEATEAADDDENAALIQDLAVENNALRALLFSPEPPERAEPPPMLRCLSGNG